MDGGLGQLGFWLGVGMVVAAVIVSGAIKERNRQAAPGAPPDQRNERHETLRALLEKGGDNAAEVLAYLRERDAAVAANLEAMERRRKVGERRGLAIVGAFMVATFSFIGGMAASTTLNHPSVGRFVVSPQTGRTVFESPPTPTGWDAYAPLGVMLAVWATGLVVATLIAAWGLRQTEE
jgi:hypothetical protein